MPEKTWVGKRDAGVMLKYEGTALTLTVVAEAVVGVAMRRDQRRITVSAVAEAMVVPFAATNVVT